MPAVSPRSAHARARTAREQRKGLPPVVLLEGSGAPNGLSVARSLGRRGIKVYVICPREAVVRFSRFATWVPDTETGTTAEEYADYLLGRQSDRFRGSVLLASYDAGVEILARHREKLLEKFLLDDCNPPAQLCLLDKLQTYEAAAVCGVPTPRFWRAESEEAVEAVRHQLVYPLLVKPLSSYEYRKHFGLTKKFEFAHDFDELIAAYRRAQAVRVSVLLLEMIPGPDDRLCSYYTYLDEKGQPLFHFTKRVLRRYPVNIGPATYHVTDWIPELIEPSLRLFRHVGLRGLANVEYKRDERDGQLKIIECNARFTGGNGVVAAAGYDLASLVYNRIVGLPLPRFGDYEVGKRLWAPVEDFYAFRQLRRRGELTLWQWLRSVARPMCLPYFQWSDPGPTLVQESRRLFQGLVRRLWRLVHHRSRQREKETA